MGVGVASAEQTAEARPFASAAELREVLTLMLADIDRDPELGPRLRSAHGAYRFAFTDVGLVLNVAGSEEGAHCIRWKFSDRIDWEPALTLEMSSEVANRYLQGRENLAIAVARGRIHCSSDARSALSLLPITRELGERYRAVIERHYPELALP